MDILQYLHEESILLVHEGAAKEEILESLLSLLEKRGLLADRQRAQEEIWEREALMSTGVGLGLAFPHIKSASVKSMGMALAVCQTPVLNYEALDGMPVYFVVLIAAPDGAQRLYLEALAKSCQLLKSDKLRNSLLSSRSPSEALTWIKVSA